jgi:hypothetical protein
VLPKKRNKKQSMNEMSVLQVARDKMNQILDDLRSNFKDNDLINWMQSPGFYETNVDCATNITVSFKHLENEDDEGFTLEVHINKIKDKLQPILVDIYLIQSNGLEIYMKEIVCNPAIEKDILKQIESILDVFYSEVKKLIPIYLNR